MCITLFCTFLSRRCITATWNFLISRPCFLEQVNTLHGNFLLLFLNFNTVLSDSTPEYFANIWQIKWNWISSIKFETVQIHFLSEFWFVVIQKFCYRGNKKKDFSSLLFSLDQCPVFKCKPCPSGNYLVDKKGCQTCQCGGKNLLLPKLTVIHHQTTLMWIWVLHVFLNSFFSLTCRKSMITKHLISYN